MTIGILSHLLKGVGQNEGGDGSDLSYQGISFLTFEAILEVVIICFGGFLAAKSGLLNVQAQKVISQLNVDIFTPCLVFTKLAPSLTFEKMADILIIPVFYAMSTGISYACSRTVGWALGLNEPEGDFVTAMAVFGNSNSLPVSLTLSLAYTLPDLLWDDIEGDTPDKVASRGILYLLIFQQLGQVLRWSWGYNKLLRKRSDMEMHAITKRKLTDYESGDGQESTALLSGFRDIPLEEGNASNSLEAESSAQNIKARANRTESISLEDNKSIDVGTPVSIGTDGEDNASNDSSLIQKNHSEAYLKWLKIKSLPVIREFIRFMNPPLYAMLISVIVACVPFLQNVFFVDENSFIHNTLTKSINQLGSVSIPLILIVLGSNLYPSNDMPPASGQYKRMIIASLLSRMILPSFILLPVITLCVKFINISILDDPIFLIVAFILTISPPAIQLSQIVQLNNIYQKEMAGVLFWGYVVLTLPTTIFIVVTSLEVLKWALQ